MDRVKILIVEDDIFSANIIKRILTNHGYEITDVVSDSKDVLNSVENNIPDLILMDIVIQGTMDGIELASIIKNKHDIPIIYLTGDASEETIQRAKITEPFGYLIKPISEMTLLTNIELTIFKQNEQIKRNLQVLKKLNDELEQKVKERTKELTANNEQLVNEIMQREQAEEKLRRSDRLAMIGKMSAILAHEIRNPLNSIKINSDILCSLENISETNMRRLQIIRKEVNRLETLVKEVLQFSKPSNYLKTEFDLHQFFESLYNQLKPELSQKKIEFRNNAEGIIVFADKEKLRQVFLNLIINAYDASFENGFISVETEVQRGQLLIFIRDGGIGIEETEKLFEPFFTTKSTGTGLGLSISQKIIERHDGEIYLVKSENGETVFCVKIPLLKTINQNV